VECAIRVRDYGMHGYRRHNSGRDGRRLCNADLGDRRGIASAD
jgi:hypothetical protein